MKELVRNIEKAALESDFSGVLSIFKEASPVYNKAFRFRDITNKLPNTTGTRFGIASGTKVFTALGICNLIDRGSITLDTPVGTFDKKFTGFIGENATIQQLLTHTSGIHDYYDEEIEQDFDHFFVDIPWYELETPSDYLPLFEGHAMKFRPGERFSYSNGGYIFLGILIEKISGLLYRDFIREHVLQKAGMESSGFFAFNELPENTANGYLEDRKTINIYQLPIRGGGDGGMFTTSSDLCAFWNHLFSNKILTKELTDTFLTTHCALNDNMGYGFGYYKTQDESIYSIEGSDAGVGFESRYVVKDRLTFNILSNITNGQHVIRQIVLDHL